MVSVLVCTYNQEKYLAQALDSILMQQCDEPFEILIGDDCSTDATDKIADDYQLRNPNIIRVIRPDKNGGASQNLVRLVNNAQGEFISICDGDDYWLCEDVLQKQLNIFHAQSEVGMICAKAKCYNQETEQYTRVLGFKGAENLMTMLRDNRDVAAPTIAFRKDLMLRCIADSKWYIDQNWFYDSVMAYWFAYNSAIKFIDEELAAYRVLANSACHSSSYDKTLEYDRRYFAVKWHFILTHPNICNEEILFELLMREYDNLSYEIANMSANKVRSSKAYKLGNSLIGPFRKTNRNENTENNNRRLLHFRS